MSHLLNGGAIVLIAAATLLALGKGAHGAWRLVVNGACLLAGLIIWINFDQSASASALPSLAAIIALLTVVGASAVESGDSRSRWGAVRMLLAAAGCLVLVTPPTAFSMILACLLGVAAVSVGSSESHIPTSRIFLLQSGCALLLLIAGFSAVATPSSEILGALQSVESSDRSWLAGTCLIVGLFMAAGLPPFHAGILDLHEKADSSQVFPYTIVPLHWFLALRIVDLLSVDALLVLRFALLAAIIIGSIMAIRAERHVFLCVARSVLLSWALLFLTSKPASVIEVLLSFSAYMTATAGLNAVFRLAEARVGRRLVKVAGLGQQLPKLAGFGLFFSLSVAGLPMTANFFKAEFVGARAATHGIELVLISYLAMALLGIAAYRNYTLTFQGPGSDEVPPGLDLRMREHLGLVTIASASVGAAILLWVLDFS